MPKSKPDAFLYPYAWDDFNRLPGNVRRQITVAINALAKNPRPSASKQLDIPDETWRSGDSAWVIGVLIAQLRTSKQ